MKGLASAPPASACSTGVSTCTATGRHGLARPRWQPLATMAVSDKWGTHLEVATMAVSDKWETHLEVVPVVQEVANL